MRVRLKLSVTVRSAGVLACELARRPAGFRPGGETPPKLAAEDGCATRPILLIAPSRITFIEDDCKPAALATDSSFPCLSQPVPAFFARFC